MEETTLIIKAPNQKYEDLKIKCQLTWTILDLKIYLCKEYPSKPIISDQRLIYSGHLLKDEQCLGDIIQSENESNTYTFHLVCPQRHVASSSEQTKAAPGTSSASASQAALAPENMNPLVNEQPFPSFAQADALPARNPLLHHLGSNNSAVMQESYNAMLNQYYQYMSYYYLSAPPATDFASYYAFANAYMTSTANATPVASTINPTPANNNNNNVNGQVNENPAPNVAVHNNNANNVNNNNNQADNEEVNRDWTEMLYSFSKAMVMLSIMYFYSSFGRLLLLIAIAFVLYLYKNARLNGAMNNILNNNNEVQNAREQQQQQPPAAVVDPANNNEDNHENNHDSDSSADADRANLLNGPAPENSRYTGLRLAWVIVSSLFTSLIPDPTPIN